jgi:hypothetical protein
VTVKRNSKAKTAKDGHMEIVTRFAGEHARVFERLGLDLLRITKEGDAIVHAKPATMDQLEATAGRLSEGGKLERSRWAWLREFELPPMETRVDVAWLDHLDKETAYEVIVEFQPVLTRDDADRLIEAIGRQLTESENERILRGGRDPSGRRWVRAQMRPQQIRRFAEGFQSIQAIHAPLLATLFAEDFDQSESPASVGSISLNPVDLPVVAVVDAGVPREHPYLARYRRGQYRHPEAEQTDPGDHGSRIASRVVFGDLEGGPGFSPPLGDCQFLDVVVPAFADDRDELNLDGKAIFESIRDVARTYSDVRVFNLSLGSYLPLGRMSENEKQERLIELQDLDNFAFEHDVVVVVSAGNTRRGVVPNVDYPGHLDDPDWALGAWAAGFNTLVVGGYVPRPNTDGVGRRQGWPSPFTRVGPGIADAPIPNFSAGAGDCTQNYQPKEGLGVGTFSKSGVWEDAIGTSHAAPIIAREAALLLRELQKYCGPDAHPFASTAKAFLRLVARREPPGTKLPPSVAALAKRTLGCGRPSAKRMSNPLSETAVFLWQGTLDRPRHAARVRVPIPREWLERASAPHAHIVCSWDTPTYAGAPDIWACRKVTIQLRPTLEAAAPRAAHGNASGAYPLIDRHYDFGKEHLLELGIQLASDEWVLEIGYEDIAPYPPQLIIDEHQRVSVALELSDKGDTAESPQAAIQAMPMVQSMVKLGGMKQPVWMPIKVPTG